MDGNGKTIIGSLVKVKEDPNNLIYEIKTSIEGLNGSIYIDRSRLPIFNRLILEKESNGS